MAVALVVERRWDLLRSPWLALGAGVALVLWAPNLVWNAQHGWAALEFNASVRDDNTGVGGRIEFLIGQLLISGIVTIIVWWPGLRWLLRAGDDRRWMRALGITALAAVALAFISGGKFHYTGPVYIALLAAGSVVWAARPAASRYRVLAVVAVGALLSLPLTLAVLPAPALGAVVAIQKEPGEMVGWPEYVAQVRGVVAGLPADQRDRTVVLTGNYAEAAFLERDAPELRAFSGQNSYWWWGPPPDDATAAVIVGYREPRLSSICPEPHLATRITNDAGIDNDENGTPVWVCDRLTAPWSQLWPGIRRYS
jgi:hypothetical protein